MATAKKITVLVPEELLTKAREATGQGITETVRQGLHLVAVKEAHQRLRELRGKVDLQINLNALREDRH